MGELINLNPKVALTDADIPDLIARDTETAAAVSAHVTALHPSAIYGFGQGVSTENVFDYGSGFLDCRNGGGTFPPGMGHMQGFQARYFYTANKWGMQLVTQNNIDNECYFRTVNQDVWGPWRRIWNDGNFTPSNYLSQAQADNRYRQTAVALTDTDIPAAIARDTETAAAIAAHVAFANPHPVYPIFNRKILSGFCPAAASGTNFYAHGLNAAKIQAFSAFAIIYPGTISESRIQPGGAVPAWLIPNATWYIDVGPSNVGIRTAAGTASQNIFGLVVTIAIDYVA